MKRMKSSLIESQYLILFYVFVNIAVTFYMHGSAAFFILCLMSFDYFLCKATFKHKHANIGSWIVNVFIMLLVIKIDSKWWRFEHIIHPNLAWIDSMFPQRMRFTQSYRFIFCDASALQWTKDLIISMRASTTWTITLF